MVKRIFKRLKRGVDLIVQNYNLRRENPTIKLSGNFFIKNTVIGKFNYIENAMIRNSEIGDFSYIGTNSKVNFCKIGKFTCIGPDVKVGLGGHPTKDFISSHPIFYSKLAQVGITFSDKDYFQEYENTYIGNDVWVGSNVIIKSGITIGDGAIIAAGAVVTKDVIPYAIIGGIPAKVIRMRFEEEIILKLLQLRWWDRDIEWLKNNFKKFHNIQNIDTLK